MLDLNEFASEFIFTARKYIHEAPNLKKEIFTSRQSIAISSMGICRILRCANQLDANDLVNLAIITTPPDAQEYAEYIAYKVLYSDLEDYLAEESYYPPEEIEESFEHDELSDPLTGNKLLLQEVLEFLDLETGINEEKIKNQLRFIDELSENIFRDMEKDKLNFENKLDITRKRLGYDILGGKEQIINKGITNWNQFYDEIRKEQIQRIPYQSYQDMINSQFFDFNGEIEQLTRNEMNRMLQSLLSLTKKHDLWLNSNNFEKNFSLNELSEALNLIDLYENSLNRYLGNQEFIEEFAPTLQKLKKLLEEMYKDKSKTINDFLNHPDLFDESDLTRSKLEELVNNLIEDKIPSNEILEKTNSLDQMFQTNSSELAYDKINKDLLDLDVEDFTSNPVDSAEWIDAFRQLLNDQLENLNNLWDDLHNLKQQLKDGLNKLENSNHFTKSIFTDYIEKIFNQMVDRSEISDKLKDTVEMMRDDGIEIPNGKIMKKGNELGMSNSEIAQLIGDLYEYLKNRLENERINYHEAVAAIKHIELSQDKIKELLDLSVQHKQDSVIGALAEKNLKGVLDGLPKNSKKAQELLEKALSAGSGENLLNEWYRCGRHIPPQFRNIIKDAMKQIFIDLVKVKSSMLLGSSQTGNIPEGTIRPYHLGDDLDTIDLEETLENILFLGKQLENVTIDDFIVRKTITGRRGIIFLCDISGSMEGTPLANLSLAVAMLLYVFSRDELGVALFESDTHVLCEIHEEIELDRIVDEILDLQARGGTMMQRAIEWGRNQMKQITSEDKMLIMVTDAMIYDFNNCLEYLNEINDMGSEIIILMPEGGYSLGNVQSILDELNARLITLRDWKSFPELVSKILSQ
jgi:Mg-chelatase subunit ChlD